MSALYRSRKALSDALRRQIGAEAFLAIHPDYVAELDSNLVPGVERSMFEVELSQAAGSELQGKGGQPPKFHAAYSSAALAVNCFGPWKKDPKELELAGVTDFDSLRFEAACDHGLLSRVPPHLDVLATAGDTVVAVESKCTEFLSPKTAKFSPQYESLVETLFEPPWLETYRALQNNPKLYQHLDAAQLVKHYLGLRNVFGGKDVTLLYLYWEPSNADEISEFRRHREEIATFADRVSGAAIRFAAESYLELWASWEERNTPRWLIGHIEQLKARYNLVV